MTSRLARWPWLAIWGVLFALQCFAISQWLTTDWRYALGATLVLQLAKLPFAAMRLGDLGRSPDDALLGVVPLANLGLFQQLLAPTPRAELWEKRRAEWVGEPTATVAFARGAMGVLRAFPLVLVVAAGFAALQTAGGYGLVNAGSTIDRGTATSVGLVVSAFLGFYTFLQVLKRRTASRGSWLPSVLFLPSVLVTIGFWVDESGGPIPLALMFMGWDLAWNSLAGAALAAIWITLGESQRKGEPGGWKRAIAAMVGRLPAVAGPHGAASHAIWIGLQVVIPGIHYALQYAFVDQVALLEPEDRPALRRASELSRGIRRRIFVLLFIGVAVAMSVQIPIAVAIDGFDALQQMIALPTAISEKTNFLWELVQIVVFAAVELGLLEMYHARVQLRPEAR